MEKTKMELYLQSVKFLFTGVCIVLAVCMSARELVRFIRNEDSTSTDFKNFDSTPGNKYPSITFCLFVPSGQIFRNEYLLDTFGINSITYQNCLKGSCTGENELKNVLAIDFDKTLIHPSNFTLAVKVTMSNGQGLKSRWKRKSPNSDLPLHKTHQSPTKLCYTLIDRFEKGTFKYMDKIQLDLRYLKQLNKNRSKTFFLSVYAHLPGQFYRDNTLIFFRRITSIGELENKLKISLYEVSIVRKRADANFPCDPTINSNDDDHWRRAAMSFWGCVPPYWKTFSSQSNFSLPTCNSSKQLEGFSHFEGPSHMYDNISVLYTPPCDEMSLAPTLYEEPHYSPDALDISVWYPKRNFKEYTNTRAFKFEAVAAGFGGFIGMFLGYSLLQLPGILCNVIQTVASRNNNS